MNELVKSYFDHYKKNYDAWKETEVSLITNMSMDEWMTEFHSAMDKFQRMYDDNKNILESITDILNDELSEDVADTLYEITFKMYTEQKNDPQLLLFCYKKLLDYYKKQKDYDKVVAIYTAIHSYYIKLEKPEAYGKNFDYSIITESMTYIDYYTQLSEKSRYRIWVIYYTYIVRLLDFGCITLSDALDKYDEIMAYSERDDIKELDASSEKIQSIKSYLKDALSIGVIQIDSAKPSTRKRFYEYTHNFFNKKAAEVKSPYALPAEHYACYLYNQFYEKKINPNQVFEKYLDYFAYKLKILKNKTAYDLDEILQCSNSIIYLNKLRTLTTDTNLINRSMDLIIDFVQQRFFKGNIELLDHVNEMLYIACKALLPFDVVGVDKEKCVTQLIIQRDLTVYIKSLITAEISISIYREMAAQYIEFFDKVKSMPSSEWKDFLYFGSLFHNIGEESVIGCFPTRWRPAFGDDELYHQKHIFYAEKLFKDVPSMAKYTELIKGHHVYFDKSGGYPSDFDRDSSDITPFIDILAVSTFIEEYTNPYWDFERKSTTVKEAIKKLEAEKGTRFNDAIVNLLLTNHTLCKDIEKIVTSKRDSVIFDVFHNWEKIQLAQDELSILDEVEKKMTIFQADGNADAFEPYLSKLHSLMIDTKRDDIKGICLFDLMRYNFYIGDYAKAFSLQSDANHLLLYTRKYDYLIMSHIYCGNAEVLRENLPAGLEHHLYILEIVKKAPECQFEKNIALSAIGNIYIKCKHYKKALEYLKQIDYSVLDIINRLNSLSMEGYCHVKLGNKKEVLRIKEQLEQLILEYKEWDIFPAHVYLAVFSQELNLKYDLDKYVGKLMRERLDENLFIFNSDEVLIYADLLEDLFLYEELENELDYYISLCDQKPTQTKIAIKLLQKQARAIALSGGAPKDLDIGEKLVKAYDIAAHEEALNLINTEAAFQENLIFKSEYDEYKSTKELMEESMKKAQSDSEHKSQFLSSMSHEIRTPINAILGLNEMILRESTEDNILQYSTDIKNASKQLLGIINDVLDYSKIEAGKMEIINQKYNLGEMINDIKNMMEPKFADKNIKFIINSNPEIPNLLYGDDLRIKQILLNLLSNACKYTKEGNVQFIIDYETKDDENITLKFMVKDTGIGLTKEQIDKLLIPFERFDHVKNRGVEGTGLGMSIVGKLLEQMHSKIIIESEYEKGSTFSFDLVQSVIDWGTIGKLDEIRKKMINSSVKVKEKNGRLYAPKASVLVVDDNAVNLKVMQALLKRTGILVTTCTSGHECLKLCSENSYNVILLDHMMPEMDGIETLKRLKEMDENTRSTPVIALTANVVESADDFYKKEGFDDLLTKPMNIDKMEDTLSYYIPDYLLEEKQE